MRVVLILRVSLSMRLSVLFSVEMLEVEESTLLSGKGTMTLKIRGLKPKTWAMLRS